MDLSNYFESAPLQKLHNEWCRNTFFKTSTTDDTDDTHLVKVKQIFDLATKFQNELESIKFHKETP